MAPINPDDIVAEWTYADTVFPISGCSTRKNLSVSFVNAFANAASGSDTLFQEEDAISWIHRHKDEEMISATAALGLLYLWNVDGGLKPIDVYIHSENEFIKAGALLGLGILNCRVRSKSDPSLAVLLDFYKDPNDTVKNASLFSLGLAYIGTNRSDVSILLIDAIDAAQNAETFAIATLATGMVNICNADPEVAQSIITKLVDWDDDEVIKSPYMILVALGLSFVFLGRKDAIKACHQKMDGLAEPLKSIFQSMLQLCGYAGTGDVSIVQKMLGEIHNQMLLSEAVPKPSNGQNLKKTELDAGLALAIPVLALGCISLGEESGNDMCARVVGSVGRYNDVAVKRAVPLTIALSSVSKPNYAVTDVLTKYARDADTIISSNASFALGCIAAGSNHARVAAVLRKLAKFHIRNNCQMFMVRMAQGMVHMGKGTMTLNPVHSDMQLMDYCALAGLLIPIVSLLDPSQFLLVKHHYLLYGLAAAMMPRWLITVNEKLCIQTVKVRVGEEIELPGKVCEPKGLTGARVYATPVLMDMDERAELHSNNFVSLTPILEGVCVVKEKRNTI